MKNANFYGLITLVVLSLPFSYGGCPNGNGISYSGETNQAIVVSNNAGDLSTGAFMGGKMGSSHSIDRPRALKLIQTLDSAIVEVDVTVPSGADVSGAAQPEIYTIQHNLE